MNINSIKPNNINDHRVVPGQFSNPKCITANQLLSLFSKTQLNKERLLKQLQQLDIDVTVLENLTLNEIYIEVQPILKNTYSVKYLGLNKNQMGIVSRRIDPTKQTQSILNQPPNLTYTINKYFYPKPLKVGRKPQKQEALNVQNLEKQIKKSFQNTKTNFKFTNFKKQKDQDPDKKKQLHGSWLSIGKMKNTIVNDKRQKLKKIDTNKIILPQSSNLKNQQVNSYAKFLSKGIILVKDC